MGSTEIIGILKSVTTILEQINKIGSGSSGGAGDSGSLDSGSLSSLS
ncbi:hypothetical protein [Prescottella subtropica]|nr:hypothetical protein [Prescottella subtropica]